MKGAVWVLIGVAAVGVAGGAGYYIYTKKKSEVPPPVAKAMAGARASGDSGAYECYNFMSQCSVGDVGGCKQYEDTCRSAQAVRSTGENTVKGVQECAAFRQNCQLGDYTSCNLYMRGCEHEDI